MGNQVPLAAVSTTTQLIRGKDAESVYDQEFVLIGEIDGTTAAASHTIGTLPIGAVVEKIYIRNKTDSAIATGTTVGIGITGDLEKYADVAHTALDDAGNVLHVSAAANNPLADATDVKINSTDGSNAAAGTVDGTWYVKITGKVSLPIAFA